ncbi:MAG: hypothetical protein H0X38_02455 [Planctomycetes bacterium]|nr:hypothetical protein [Planctomycetota bacterium]
MSLSPLDRLTWLLQVTMVQPQFPAGVLRVAIWLAEQARDGRMVYSIDAVAAQTRLHYNTAQRALADLVKAGFLSIELKATQRHHAHYCMLRVTPQGDARGVSGSPFKVTLDQPRVTTAGAQGHLGPPPRVTTEGDLQEDARGLEGGRDANTPAPAPGLEGQGSATAGEQTARPEPRAVLDRIAELEYLGVVFARQDGAAWSRLIREDLGDRFPGKALKALIARHPAMKHNFASLAPLLREAWAKHLAKRQQPEPEPAV